MYILYGFFVRIGFIGLYGFSIFVAFSVVILNLYFDIFIRLVVVNIVFVSVCLWVLVYLVVVVWRRFTM